MDYLTLPNDLSVPHDDGAADHLPGMKAPHVRLHSTAGETVSLDALGPGRTVLCQCNLKRWPAHL